MPPPSDAQLLRDYAAHGADAAFTELVQRHTNLVYSAAARQVDSPDAAAEIAQRVFIGLARGAHELAPRLAADASLAGWLCRSARNLSLNHRRDEFRRSTRERHAMENLHPATDAAPDWESLRRILDDALAELDEPDYDALVLRFFQQQDFRSVGAALGVSDDTAQKRVARALEKLREHLAQRGHRTTAAALAAVIAANAVTAAPLGLAATISAAAVVTGTAVSTSTLIAATKTIAMTTLQKTLVTATVAILAGAGIYEARQATQLRDQNQTLQQAQAPLTEQNQQLQKERDAATNRLVGLLAENARLKSNPNQNELLKLRGEVGVLRMQNQTLTPRTVSSSATSKEKSLETGFGNLGKYISIESALDVGSSTPETFLQTFIFAMHSGNVALLEQLGNPFTGQSKPGEVAGEMSESKAAFFKTIQTAFINSAGFRLSSKIENNGQAYTVRLDSEPSPDRQVESLKNFFLTIYIERKDSGWMLGANPSDETNAQSK